MMHEKIRGHINVIRERAEREGHHDVLESCDEITEYVNEMEWSM